MGYTAYVIIALWAILSTIALMNYLEYTKDLRGWELALFVLVFAIGGPTFAANQILTALLDYILPEGWDDNDTDET